MVKSDDAIYYDDNYGEKDRRTVNISLCVYKSPHGNILGPSHFPNVCRLSAS